MKTELDLAGELKRQLNMGLGEAMHSLSDRDKVEFKVRHPWADLVVGDFEIRVINREKFGLDPQ